MRNVHAAILVLVVSAFLLAPALAQGPGMGRGPMDRMADRHSQETHEREWGNLSETARARGLERAESAKLFARFAYANGNATGRFVSFGLDAATGAVRDFALNVNNTNATFFTAVTPTGFMGNGTPRATGATLRHDGGNVTFSAHNNPTGMFAYRGENVSVSFQAAPNATLTSESNRSVMVVVGTLHGHVILHGNGTLSVTGSTLTATSTGAMGGVVFAAHPGGDAGGLSTANLHAVRDAMAQGRVGGILSVVDAGGAAVTDATYLGVAMKARNVSQGRVNVTVSSADPAGRAVVIHLDSGIINASQGGNVTVALDGRPIPRASNATNALLGAPGTPAAAWYLTNGTGGVQVIVNVPGFSDHDIGISATGATGGPVMTSPVGTSPVGTSPVATSPVGTSPVGGSPPATSPAATSPGVTPPADEDNDSPAPGLALVALALLGGALILRRR